MTFEIGLILLLLLAVLALLATTRITPDVVMVAAMAVLMMTGVLTPKEALAGFSNAGIITVAVLYVVAAGLKETGAIQFIAHRILGRPSTVRNAQVRMLLPTFLLSSVMNNTAVVAIMIPAIQEWCQRIRISASKLLLPLSYATMISGTLTLIGTSTNLVVDGLLQQHMGLALGMFELAWLGVPVMIAGGLFLVFFSERLLPDNSSVTEQLEQIRQYAVEVEISLQSPLIGKTITEAGLRNLAHTYLAEIERDQQLLKAVAPETLLQAGDLLRFIGAPEGANELRRMNGLQPAREDVEKLKLASHQRHLVEVVLSQEFPSLGKTIRESAFRTHYKAVILSVSREGERLPGKLGDIRFAVGDTLLLEADQTFVQQYRFRRDFLLTSALNDSTPPDFRKAPIAIGWLVLLVILSSTSILSILEAAILSAGGMLATGCITVARGRRSIDLSVIVAIAASFALGAALTKTGAAISVAQLFLGFGDGPLNPWLALALIYIMTSIMTELITNNAAAVLMFPISVAVAEQLGVSFMPFVIAIMFAASTSFITPLGYQTNLMVYGPGGYRWRDYVRLGLPLNLVVATVSIGLIPLFWAF